MHGFSCMLCPEWNAILFIIDNGMTFKLVLLLLHFICHQHIVEFDKHQERQHNFPQFFHLSPYNIYFLHFSWSHSFVQQRHLSDSQVNNRRSKTLRNGELIEEKWSGVQVRNIEEKLCSDMKILINLSFACPCD